MSALTVYISHLLILLLHLVTSNENWFIATNINLTWNSSKINDNTITISLCITSPISNNCSFSIKNVNTHHFFIQNPSHPFKIHRTIITPLYKHRTYPIMVRSDSMQQILISQHKQNNYKSNKIPPDISSPPHHPHHPQIQQHHHHWTYYNPFITTHLNQS